MFNRRDLMASAAELAVAAPLAHASAKPASHYILTLEQWGRFDYSTSILGLYSTLEAAQSAGRRIADDAALGFEGDELWEDGSGEQEGVLSGPVSGSVWVLGYNEEVRLAIFEVPLTA